MDRHVDHRWDESLEVHCHLGLPGDVRCYEVFAPDPLAVAITGHLCALSRNHPGGQKFRVGPLWWKRIYESAENVEQQNDSLDG